jgi:hypothetical protein
MTLTAFPPPPVAKPSTQHQRVRRISHVSGVPIQPKGAVQSLHQTLFLEQMPGSDTVIAAGDCLGSDGCIQEPMRFSASRIGWMALRALVPPRVEYAITGLGSEMLDSVAPLRLWVAKSVQRFENCRTAFDSRKP